MELPLVTINIPTYNQERSILRAVESALMQDYPRLEVVVADDCSTDHTPQLFHEQKDDRLRYIRNETNLGRVANYRKSLYEYARGEWVVNLDGDDYFTDPRFISRGMNEILKFTRQGRHIVYYQSAIRVRNEETGQEFRCSHKLLKGQQSSVMGMDYFLLFFNNEFFAHLSTIYNRAKAMETGFYEHDTLSTDSESLLKLALNGDVILDNTVTGTWMVHQGNASRGFVSQLDELERTYTRVGKYAEKFLDKQVAENWINTAIRAVRKNHYEALANNGQLGDLVKAFFSGQNMSKRTLIQFLKAATRKKV